MPLMGTCEECAENKPIHVPNERRILKNGPDGRRLCSRHFREAWREHDEKELERS